MNALPMPTGFFKAILLLTLVCPASLCLRAAEAEAPLFPDKQLETGVRKFVFEKRDTDKPLVEADVANLSTVKVNGNSIADLAGMEKCQSLASLDLARNKIKNLQPLKELKKIQYLN